MPPGGLVLDLLKRDTMMRYLRGPELLRQDVLGHLAGAGTPHVLIDEIQKVPELLDEVHGLIESHAVTFWLTGSSARKLRRGGVNLLAGRAALRHLHPLTWHEQGQSADLERNLRYGALPSVVTGADADAVDLLKSYGDSYLREEIQAEAAVRQLGAFARFLDVVAAQNGDLLNYTSIGSDAGVAKRTVVDYVQVLEDTMLAFRLEPWTRSPRARLLAHPKLYFFDTGVANALRGRLLAQPDAAERGRLFEHWLILQVRAAMDYQFPETKLYFWRTSNGAEVDLLLERHGKLRVAIEIKVRETPRGSDLAGLRSFGQAHPQVPRVVVCTTPRPLLLDNDIMALPFGYFLQELGQWLQ